MRLLDEDCLGHPLAVRCLAPTQESLDRALSWLGTDALRLKSDAAGRLRGSRPKPPKLDDALDVESVGRHVNEVSAVPLVQWGRSRVLLMGDAERGDLRRGVRSLSLGGVDVLKVAHHASSGSHDRDFQAAAAARVAIVTPFQYGRTPQPPQPAGLGLHQPPDGRLYLTDPPLWLTPPLRRAGVPGARTHADVTHPDSAASVSLDAEGGLTEPVLHGRALRWLPSR